MDVCIVRINLEKLISITETKKRILTQEGGGFIQDLLVPAVTSCNKMKRKIELVDEEDETERCADESEDEEPTIKDVLSNLSRWLKSVFLICCH